MIPNLHVGNIIQQPMIPKSPSWTYNAAAYDTKSPSWTYNVAAYDTKSPSWTYNAAAHDTKISKLDIYCRDL